MLAVKKVPIFRHLNKQQTEKVVMSLQDRKCGHGEIVIRQGWARSLENDIHSIHSSS